MKQVKAGTTVKNQIEEAIEDYMLHNPDQSLNKEWQYTATEQVYNGSAEYKVIVMLFPPSRFSRCGAALFFHPHLGSWGANLNGLSALRVGKPSIRYTVEQMKRLGGKPMWPELGY